MKAYDKKILIVSEWACDPPGGTGEYYHISIENDFKNTVDAISDAINNLFESLEDDEIDELSSLYEELTPTKEELKMFSFDNGGVGVYCPVACDEKDAVESLYQFLKDNAFEYDFGINDILDVADMDNVDWDEYTISREDAETILNAVQHPNDAKCIEKLVELVEWWIEEHNGEAF